MASCIPGTSCTSPESLSFRDHYVDLFNGIQNPVPLSARLYSAGLLAKNTRVKIKEMRLTEDKVAELLDAIETAIGLDSQNFYKFVDELEKELDSRMQHLCDGLRSTCGEFNECMSDSYILTAVWYL